MLGVEIGKMAHSNDVLKTIIVLAAFVVTAKSEGVYCEPTVCLVNQKCCGYNVCCNTQEPLLYILASIPVCIILLLCCCFYNNCALGRCMRRYVTDRILARSYSDQALLVDKV